MCVALRTVTVARVCRSLRGRPNGAYPQELTPACATCPSAFLRYPPAHCRPKEITEIRTFLETARRKDARNVKILKQGKITKFKIRCSKVSHRTPLASAPAAPDGSWGNGVETTAW
jgi:hypothetical protein